jgi:GntR family transcriptional regulator, uxu operon transcriptional repressor
MPIQAVEPRRLYRRIADQIGALIYSGEFAPGKRLPPERNLAQQFGVSRPSVREALIALEIAGLVDVRVGSGIYVREASAAAALTRRAMPGGPDQPDPGPLEVLRARWLIEGEIAALAASHAREADLDAIRDTLFTMAEENARGGGTQEADRLFHLRVAEASGNSALALVVRGLWDQRAGPMYAKFEQHFSSPKLRAQSLTDHQAIFASLEKRDSRGARAAMRRHLNRVFKEFSQAWKHSTRHTGAEVLVHDRRNDMNIVL